jgi:preprotein translocase subunit SecF
MVGVVLVGTYTSIFIAAPILIYLGVGENRADAPDTAEPAAKAGKPALAGASAKK